jgi:hypothetical protein
MFFSPFFWGIVGALTEIGRRDPLRFGREKTFGLEERVDI